MRYTKNMKNINYPGCDGVYFGTRPDESTFNKMLNQESENLAKKIFLDICCDGCMCQSEEDHKKE